MKIDLATIKKEKKNQVDLNFLLNLDTIDYYGDEIKVPSPVSVTGKLYVIDERLYITCNIKADLQVGCSRCLKSFTYELDEKVNAELVREESVIENDNLEDDLIFYQNDEIELVEMIKESIFINVPLKTICKDNCKGLCVQCGKDLNVEDCQCVIEEEEEEILDPRLAKLKELLQDD